VEEEVIPPATPVVIASAGRTFCTPETLAEGLMAGARGVRIALGLRDRDPVADMAAVRAASERKGIHADVYLDLPATRPRIGCIAPVLFETGDVVILSDIPESDATNTVPLPGLSAHLPAIRTGDRAVFRDGRQVYRITGVCRDSLETRCEACTEPVEASNACSFPDSPVRFEPLCAGDTAILEHMASAGLCPDWVLVSLVNHAEQVEAVRGELGRIWPGHMIRLMPKIETVPAVEHLAALLDTADGCLVGRGDLGVALPPEQIPVVQERAAALARDRGKACTVATQILERFAETGVPYRAELGDIAQMVRQRVHGVVLCQETSDSPRPAACIDLARRVIEACRDMESEP
jgi:pyruvate kinase